MLDVRMSISIIVVVVLMDVWPGSLWNFFSMKAF